MFARARAPHPGAGASGRCESPAGAIAEVGILLDLMRRLRMTILNKADRKQGGDMTDESISARIQGLGQQANAPFAITKIGHVVLNVRDLARSVRFYTRVLGFKISDIYEQELVPGGMVFLRFNTDHHGVALIGALPEDAQNIELHHMAFAVSTLDEVFQAREHLEKNGVAIKFHGRRRAGVQIAVEFPDPDGHMLEIYWGLDQVGSDGITRPPSEWKGARSLEDAIDNPVRGQVARVQDERLIRRK
jgi:catechol 2,3-dioxygenase-like lactoylglutathione lyase family enzyme